MKKAKKADNSLRSLPNIGKVMDTLFELSNTGPNQSLPFPAYLSLLIKRILDAGFVEIVENKTSMQIGRVKTTPDFLVITDKGREFIQSLGIKEIGY